MILCSDNSLYTGITTDINRRINEHASGRGAKYFRGRQPEGLVYLERGHTRSTAGLRERQIKALVAVEKRRLILSDCNEMINHFKLQRRKS
ncbi:MAG: hypothetical protein CSYNP_00471 [Syntrophus sp. SKADARSKE-3]|nr:hypothetical protein [Syntrophus sp. SKADARSKE-3]